MKRAVDIVGAILFLLIFSVPMLLICTWISIVSPGSPFFTQTRLGKDRVPFKIWKFRSMKIGTGSGKPKDLVMSKGDRRLILGGHWLRKTHLDETPQFLLVLLGVMSMVGPRPVTPEIAVEQRKTVENYDDRFRVKQGIFGLAQLLFPREGISARSARTKARLDNWYVARQNMQLDFLIIRRTPFKVIRQPGV